MKKNFRSTDSAFSRRGQGSSQRNQTPATRAEQRPRSSQPQNHHSTKSSVSFPKSWRQVAGTHAIRETLKIRPKSIKAVFLQKGWNSSQDLRDLTEDLKKFKVSFEEKTDSDLQKICPSHQGAVLFSDQTPEFDFHQSGWESESLLLALDGVEDPHNLGAILRTSWLMGVSGVIVPEDRAVGLTATVHKVACGGVEHVPLAKTNNFTEPFKTLKEAGFWVFGMSHKAKKTIYDLQIPEKVIWVMGAEDKGLRIPTERACDELVSIPQLSADASYNVSVATALAIGETRRQWNLTQKKGSR